MGGSRRASADGRDDGGRHGGRAVADRHRARLLQRDRVCQRASSCGARGSGPPRWRDGASNSPTWWRTPASAWFTAPRSWSWTAPGRRRWKRRGGPASARARRNRASGGKPPTGEGEMHRLRGDSPRPSRPTARRADAGGSPARASRCCAWLRAKPTRPQPRSAGRGRDRASRLARAAAARLRRDPACRRRPGRPRGAPVRSSSGSPRVTRCMLDAMARRRGERSAWQRAMLRAALTALRRAWQQWQGSRRPTRLHASACSWAACRSLGDDDAATLELEAARGVFAELGAAPDLARVDSLAGPGAGAPWLDARASSRFCGLSPPGEQPGDRRRAGAQRAHGRPAPAEHLRQAPGLLPHGRRRFAYEHGLA